jgi:hypothetical protein
MEAINRHRLWQRVMLKVMVVTYAKMNHQNIILSVTMALMTKNRQVSHCQAVKMD